jgi:drug/metabolite transporter (DMT)-like permease
MSHTRAAALMVLVTFLWSLAGVISRHLESAQSFEITFWRSGFNAIALAVALTWLRGSRLWRDLLAAGREIWLSGLCWSVMFTAFMLAITLTTVANVLVVMAIGPLLTALAARALLAHHLPLRTWLAIAGAGGGIGWMFLDQVQAGTSLTGSLVALAVPVAAAINWTVLQSVGHRAKTEPRRARGQSSNAVAADEPSHNLPAHDLPTQDMLPAVLVGAIISALVTLPLAWPFQATAHDLGLLAFLGAFQLALPCLLVVRLTQILSGPEISLLGLLEVLFGVLWAWLGANEVPSSATLLGATVVIAALASNAYAEYLGERNLKTQTP